MILDILKDYIQKAFNESGYDIDIRIIKSNREDLCDYQCDDVFKIAKQYHKNPIEVGETIVNIINNYNDFNEYFTEVTFAKPGFINMKISDKLINTTINKMINSDKYNLKLEEKLTYFLDYGGPNVAKPLHVGHLRTAIIGESIKRIINFMGHKTVCDVHLGDYGLQIGEVIYAILEDKLTIDEITLEYLDEAYPKMSKLCKENKEILDKCAQITKDLQDGNVEYQKIWKKIKEVSVQDIKRIYDYLSVSFDLWEGESDGYKYIDSVTEILNEHNLLMDSEGAKVIEVKEETDTKEIPPLIYRKSNGAYLYGTTDMAAIYERVKLYNPNYILYVTDLRQSLHFNQVFRSCNKAKITENVTLEHLGYGTVNGTDGKPFKTRSGDTVKLNDLFNQVKEVFISTKDSNKDMSETDLNIIVNAIIKFADLQNNREKDYIFDIQKFSNVVGKTGPYILYTYLRMNKILEQENMDLNLLSNDIYNKYDRDLRLKLLDLPTVINLAYKERMPHYIAEYVYDICVLDNIFYQNNHVSTADNNTKKQWLTLIKFTNRVLKDLLNLLTIDIPSKM